MQWRPSRSLRPSTITPTWGLGMERRGVQTYLGWTPRQAEWGGPLQQHWYQNWQWYWWGPCWRECPQFYHQCKWECPWYRRWRWRGLCECLNLFMSETQPANMKRICSVDWMCHCLGCPSSLIFLVPGCLSSSPPIDQQYAQTVSFPLLCSFSCLFSLVELLVWNHYTLLVSSSLVSALFWYFFWLVNCNVLWEATMLNQQMMG